MLKEDSSGAGTEASLGTETTGCFPCSPDCFVVISIKASIHSDCLCRGTCVRVLTLNGFSLLVCAIDPNPFTPFPNKLLAALISGSSRPVIVAGTDLWMTTQPHSLPLTGTSFLPSTTQMCMFTPSWPQWITSTDVSCGPTRNYTQNPQNPTTFGASPSIPSPPHPSAFSFPPPFSFFLTAKL